MLNNVTNDRSRNAIEMSSEIVEVPVNSFIEHYAPFVPTGNQVQQCLDGLLASNRLCKSEDGSFAFVDCPSRPSSEFNLESEFIFLSTVCQAISNTKIHGRPASCMLKQCPRNNTNSEIPGSNHMTDGFFTPFQSTVPGGEAQGSKAFTADIVANCEWKLKSFAQNDSDVRYYHGSLPPLTLSTEPEEDNQQRGAQHEQRPSAEFYL